MLSRAEYTGIMLYSWKTQIQQIKPESDWYYLASLEVALADHFDAEPFLILGQYFISVSE